MAKSPDKVKAALIEFIKLLEGSINLYAVVLFGSYAQGKPKEYSDIDLAVFSEDFGNNPLEEMERLLKLRRGIDTDIEPLPFSRKDFFEHSKADFLEEILQHGRIIYQEGKLIWQNLTA